MVGQFKTFAGLFVIGTTLSLALGTLVSAVAQNARRSTAALQQAEASAARVEHIAMADAFADPPFEEGPAMEARDAEGQTLRFPTLALDVDVQVHGDVADVTLRQTFANPSDAPVNARYTFPLPAGAAVYAMQMEVGTERIRAEIQEKQEAEATFQAAQENGQAAALVTQSRPNVFQQRVANLVPGLPIEVELRYVYALPQRDGRFELALPLVVGPRYRAGGDGYEEPLPAGSAEVPAASSATTPRARVQLDVQIEGGVPVFDLQSTTHDLRATWRDETAVALAPAEGPIADDRDFVLTYRLGGDDIRAGALSTWDEGRGTLSVRVAPPAALRDAEIVPREVVFVLDTSGSMSGLPIDTSKALVTRTLETLRPSDHFRVIQFGSRATEYSRTALPATPENVANALAYVEGLRGGGGTEMLAGIVQALTPAPVPGALRLVVFLTDGYIGNEATILEALESQRDEARLVAFGVGSSVNRYLLEEMGHSGRGFTRIMDLDEDPDEVVAELHARLDRPVLTDVHVDWGTLDVGEVYPREIPDLFAGHSVRVEARYAEAGTHTVTVRGTQNGEPVALPVQVTLAAEASNDGAALTRMWARAAIAERMREHRRASLGVDADAARASALQSEVTALGLTHELVTRWTSFVAVSERIVNPDADATAGEPPVRTPAPHGVQALSAQGGFAGAAAPEPITWLATLSALGVAAGARRRRTRAPNE